MNKAKEILLTIDPELVEEVYPYYPSKAYANTLADTVKNNMHRLDTLAQTVKKHSDCKDISKLKDSLKDLVTLAGNLWKEVDRAGANK